MEGLHGWVSTLEYQTVVIKMLIASVIWGLIIENDPGSWILIAINWGAQSVINSVNQLSFEIGVFTCCLAMTSCGNSKISYTPFSNEYLFNNGLHNYPKPWVLTIQYGYRSTAISESGMYYNGFSFCELTFFEQCSSNVFLLVQTEQDVVQQSCQWSCWRCCSKNITNKNADHCIVGLNYQMANHLRLFFKRFGLTFSQCGTTVIGWIALSANNCFRKI